MCYLLIFAQDDGILVIPTVADPPPKLGGKESLSEEYKNRNLGLLSIASMSGCCQVKFSHSLFSCQKGVTVLWNSTSLHSEHLTLRGYLFSVRMNSWYLFSKLVFELLVLGHSTIGIS